MKQKSKDSFFIGYGKTPDRDKRFLLTAVPLLVLGAAGFANLFALSQQKPAAAKWGENDLSLRGRLIKQPYPHILVANNYTPRGYDTVFLVQEGKLGAQSLVDEVEERYVEAKGKLITRHDSPSNYLLETISVMPLRRDISIQGDNRRDFGKHRLVGHIVDSKCHYGVMRPADGITHKACASLCIRSGIPPFFIPHCQSISKIFLATNPQGEAQPEPFLPYILDTISVEGQLIAINNYFEFRLNPQSIEVLAPSLKHPLKPPLKHPS